MYSSVDIGDSHDQLHASEAEHRVSNSLSVISSLVQLKARHANVEEVRRTLLDVAARIESVARLHRMLAQAGSTAVPVAQFLQDVCAAMAAVATDQDRFTVECASELTVPAETALRLGLLTAELFTNAVKYAHPTGLPTTIKVACRQERDGTLVFSFQDDGIGFPENFDPTRSETLGMLVLQSLTHQLHGVSEWQDVGIGLRFVCRIPACKHAGEKT